MNRKYLVAVALLAVLAIVFGVVGTVAPPLAEETSAITPQQESSPDSVGHFQNPPTYDSGWVDVREKAGQYFNLTHNLNTTEVFVDATGEYFVAGASMWNRAYGGTSSDVAYSVVQTSDGGYALAGCTYSYGVGGDFWLVKTDAAGNALWNQTYGGTYDDYAYSVVQTGDGGYALAGYTYSYGVGTPSDANFYLVKTGAGSLGPPHQRNFSTDSGLAWTRLTNTTITLYRGSKDPYWQYVRVRIWLIKEPSWIYGDINMDGVVDAKDLYILSQNYGKTFSLLSLSGIIAIAGIHTIKKRKQPKQISYIS